MCAKRIVIVFSILYFVCLTGLVSADSQSDPRVLTATKLLALCYQARVLFQEPDEFVLTKYEDKYTWVKKLYGPVGGTEVFGYITETPSKIYIVFRGTIGFNDFLRDLMFWKTPFRCVSDAGNVHKGFYSIYSGTGEMQPTSMRDSILKRLNKLDPNKPLYITGFSLGGALATLCALDVSQNSAFKHPIVYTFAAPRVGDQKFVNKYNASIEKTVRIINKQDYVPFNPMQCFGYHHVKGEVILNADQGRIDKNHKITTAYFPALASNVFHYAKDKLEKLKNKYPDLLPILPDLLPDPSWEDGDAEIGEDLAE